MGVLAKFMENGLTPGEETLAVKLRGVDPGKTVWGATIHLYLKDNKPAEIRQLIQTLKEQAGDNPPLMEGVLGFDILKEEVL